MNFEEHLQNGFIFEMMETMVSATEIFNQLLLNNLEKYFGIRNALITVFDFDGNFLSLTDPKRIYIGGEHPYANIAKRDICAQKINDECRRANMWHDNLTPYIYRSTDLFAGNDIQTSEYVRFLNEVMHTKYMVIMPFDIYGCIHLCVYKGENETDFSDRELDNMKVIYRYIAQTFKSFKTLEKPKIVSNIKDEVIMAKEDAYIITDINHNILSCNKRALEYMAEITGKTLKTGDSTEEVALLSFLLHGINDVNTIKTTTINGFVFQVHPFPMSYIHGMVELYHWITIGKSGESMPKSKPSVIIPLTKRERRVAELLCDGLSYQAIADEMFISFHTVKNHVQNIFSKYGVNTRYQFYQIYKGNMI